MQKVTEAVATGKRTQKYPARQSFKGNRKKFIPGAIRKAATGFDDAEVRFLCIVGLSGATDQGLVDTKTAGDLLRNLDAAGRAGRISMLRKMLPRLSDEELDVWACMFFRLWAAHGLGEHGAAAVRLAFAHVNLSGQRGTYPKADVGLYREVHGLIDAMPRSYIELLRKALHESALNLKSPESAEVQHAAG